MDAAVVEVGAAFGDDEAVACACEIADIGAAVEGFEETGEVSGGDADALVGDGRWRWGYGVGGDEDGGAEDCGEGDWGETEECGGITRGVS